MSSATFHVSEAHEPTARALGFADARAFLEDPRVVTWRKLDARENCVFTGVFNTKPVRWHIKRYFSRDGWRRVERELAAIDRINAAGIPTVEAVAWGAVPGAGAFLTLDDLAGFEDAEKLVQRGLDFQEALLEPTARLAAKLHAARLHHRDLYLCHFFANVDQPDELRLIDVARVRPVPRLFPRRWIVKDLAQFVHSLRKLGQSEAVQRRWLEAYGSDASALWPAIDRKAKWIARHDARLQQRQPTRNVSLPGASG